MRATVPLPGKVHQNIYMSESQEQRTVQYQEILDYIKRISICVTV